MPTTRPAHHRHVWIAVAAATIMAVPSPAHAQERAATLFPLRCEGAEAITTSPVSGLPLVAGSCATASPTAPGVVEPRAAEPGDCLVPGYDDRCEAWTAPKYDGPLAGDDYPGFGSFDRHTTVLPHPTADLLFVGGTSAAGDDADFVEIAYRASTGVPVWTQTYGGFEERTLAYQHSIALSPDGGTLFALGQASEPGVYDYETLLLAFDALTGRLLWDRLVFAGLDAIETRSITLPDGRVEDRLYGAGTRGEEENGSVLPKGTVFAFDPDDGTTLWMTSFPGATSDGSRFNELVISPDGATVYAGGGEHLPSRLANNFLTVAFRALDGAVVWHSRDTLTQPTTGHNGISDMAITPDGSRVIVAGFDPFSSGSLLGGSWRAMVTVARDAETGEVVWRRDYAGEVEGERHFYFNLFQGMLGISPDGSSVVATAAASNNSNTATVAYDVATGTKRWGVETNDPVHAYAFTNYLGYYPTVVVGNDRAYVSNRRGTGYSQYRTVTAAYSLTGGATAWTGRLGFSKTLLGGNALSPDGRRVFVTASEQLGSLGFPVPDPNVDSTDIVTVSYEA